jgi:hypothetical protein
MLAAIAYLIAHGEQNSMARSKPSKPPLSPEQEPKPRRRRRREWEIFENDIPEHVVTEGRSPTGTIYINVPARRAWFGQHPQSGDVLGPFDSQAEAHAAVDEVYAAKASANAARNTELLAWDNVKEFIGFVVYGVFLSITAGVLCGMIPALELYWLWSLFVPKHHFYPTGYAVYGVFSLGFFVVCWWCDEGGPPRPGRGSLGSSARKRITNILISFFAIALLAMVGIEIMRGRFLDN